MKWILRVSLLLMLTACGEEEAIKPFAFKGLDFPSEIKANQSFFKSVFVENSTAGMTVSGVNLPDWISFDEKTMQIAGRPDHEYADESYSFSFLAEDENQSLESEVFTITVNHTDLTIDSAEQSYLVNEGSVFSLTLDAEAEEGVLSFSLVNEPEWLEINEQTGEIFGTPSHNYAGVSHTDIQIQVGDGYRSILSNSFSIDVQLVPIAFAQSNSTSLHVEEDVPFSFTPDLDYNPGDLTFSAINLPSWMDKDSASGEISGMFTHGTEAGVYSNVEVTATDGERETTLENITINGIEINDNPVVESGVIELIEFQQTYTFPVSYSDEETIKDSLLVSVSEESPYFDVSITQQGVVTLALLDSAPALQEGLIFNLTVSDGEKSTESPVEINITEPDPFNCGIQFHR